jgi:hypothetical protein
MCSTKENLLLILGSMLPVFPQSAIEMYCNLYQPLNASPEILKHGLYVMKPLNLVRR